MTTAGNPNVLAAVGLIIMACGLGILARAILSATSEDGGGMRRAAARSRVDLAFAAPLLLVGMVMLAGAQFGPVGGSPMLTSLLLLAAFFLIVYGALEGLIVESLAAVRAEAAQSTRLKLISPPAGLVPFNAPTPAQPAIVEYAEAKVEQLATQ